MNKLKRFLGLGGMKLAVIDVVFLVLPLLMFLSYQPLIYLGYGRGTNYEISLFQIGLVVFGLVGLRTAWRNRSELVKNKAVVVTGVFAILAIVSLLWTPNKVRGVLAAGLVVVLFLAFLTVRYVSDLKKVLPVFMKLLVVGAVLASIFAWFQVIGEALGLAQSVTLLPDNYRAALFGFARPTAGAQEPQFFASQLLLPILLLVYRVISGKAKKIEKAVLVFLVMTVVVTISRGAVLALGAGVLVLFVHYRKKLAGIGMAAVLGLSGVVLGFVAMGLAAQVNGANSESFYTAVSKSVNQLSMGVIKLPEKKTDDAKSGDGSGYVKESTRERTTMSRMAGRTIVSDLRTAVFGVGIGGTGFAYHNRYQCVESCINFNEYLDVAVEMGLLGLTLMVVMVVGLFRGLGKRWYLRAVLVAFLVQWMFFAGYPNSLPVWFLMVVMYAVTLVGKGKLVYESD